MGYQSVLRQAAAQGAVLLKNEENTLPLLQNDSAAVFGRCQIDYYKSGTGSGGSVHVPFSINLIQGFENLEKEGWLIPSINKAVLQVYDKWIKENPFDTGNGEWASEPWTQKEMPVTRELLELCNPKEKAFYVIGRTAGEDKDNKPEKGSYFLTDQEYSNIKILCGYFESVTVILNVSNIIDLSWIENAELNGSIKAVLVSWQGGMQGGQALADILCGKENPSGKLTDTIAYSINDYPSTKNFSNENDEIYAEDIYVGYRYFSTFAPEKVQFPFGFGLSYTTFKIEKDNMAFDAEFIIVRAIITNTGKMPGREVAQIYVECPQGKLGKPARVLAGFAKSKLLQPGESQIVRIVVEIEELASYDDSGITGHPYSYVLESGTYKVYLGTDCNAGMRLKNDAGMEVRLDKTLVVKELSQCLAPTKEFLRIKPFKKNPDGTYKVWNEPAPQSKENLELKIAGCMPKELELSSEQPGETVTFADVCRDVSKIDRFVAQLSDEELFTIVRGEGMMSRKVTAGIASAFGGISQALHDRLIPAAGCADGPSGIRHDNGKEANLVPIGTLLACTWNPQIVEDVYEYVAGEMKEKQIDLLLGPGCNIHRNPLNGRNFEYFSEDPFVSGIMAVAVCKGLARNGGIGTIKHFALNNQEAHRRTENSVASERAIREIYLKPFEIAVKKGNARAVMTSYNGINGHKSASNFDLNVSILRNEWHFTGLVMTDWWAAMNHIVNGGEATGRNVSQMVKARNDVYMVVVNDTADKGGFGDDLEEAFKNGIVSRAELQLCAKDIVLFITETTAAKVPLRPLKNDIVVHKVLDKSEIPAGAKILAEGIYADTKELEGSVYYHLEEDSYCEVYGSFLKDGGETLSQSITNVLINDESVGSFECRSTDGKEVYTTAVQLFLKAGFYKINLAHTKPGITVVKLCLMKEEASPINTGEYQ